MTSRKKMLKNTIKNTDLKYININTDHGYLKREKELFFSICQEQMTSFCMEDLVLILFGEKTGKQGLICIIWTFPN